ncbi:MAG: hypothetical protein ABSG53_18920 [Thermoguttaceae bacterium]|jgi:hypothetical protein
MTVYRTGMHHDPLISSRAKPLTSWGHDWVVLTLMVRCPFWSPTKVWTLQTQRDKARGTSRPDGPASGEQSRWPPIQFSPARRDAF